MNCIINWGLICHQAKSNKYKFLNRDIVEKDKNKIQPIPIAVIVTPGKDKILCINQPRLIFQ